MLCYERYIESVLSIGSDERGVLRVGSIPVAILPYFQFPWILSIKYEGLAQHNELGAYFGPHTV